MMIEDAISKACAEAGITPPKNRAYGRWLPTDTLSGRNGKGDGRVIINETTVTAWNWQTGAKVTVGLNGAHQRTDRQQVARDIKRERARKAEQAERAAHTAALLLKSSALSTHRYLERKGLPDEKTLVIDADKVRSIGGAYLIPEGRQQAIVIPARLGSRITSAQLIWDDGTKKFLFGGEIAGACHRIATGTETWLCEGYATALSLRAGLKSLYRSATILVCFSASNIEVVARKVCGSKCFIAADHDKPLPQFNGLGTGEYYAKQTNKPYLMPPDIGTDLNDVHLSAGLYAVQSLILELTRRASSALDGAR